MPQHPSPSPHERLRSIDLARGIAVLLMIAAHASDAFLADRWKHNEVWYGVNILFGFVAPAFIALSGLTLYPALMRRIGREPATGRSSPIAPRYLRMLLLGYWLQIPVLSLRQLLFNQRPQELARLFDANILQVIALAGLLLLGFHRGLRSLDRVRVLALLACIVAVALAPYLWTGDFHLRLPLPLRSYFAPSPPATFPLLPYLAYFMTGFFAAPWLIAAARDGRRRIIVITAGALLAAAGLALAPLLADAHPHDDFWGPSVQHFLFRLGGVVLLAALALAYAEWRQQGSAWLAYAGRNSLAIYVLHLMLIYGSPMTMGMRYWFGGALGGALGPFATLAIIAAVLLLCIAAVRFWERLRARNPDVALWLKRLWWALFWGFFLLQP